MRRLLLPLLLLVSLCSGGQSFTMIPDSSTLTGVNLERVAESYPFLTADGLRLYFATEHGSADAIYLMTRPSVAASFGKPAPVGGLGAKHGQFAATLTADERTIYYTDRVGYKKQSIFFATRASVSDTFSAPLPVPGISSRAHTVAISPDGRELVAVVSDTTARTTDDVLEHYSWEGTTFRRRGRLSVPAGFVATPGQFSKDGRSFIINAELPLPEEGEPVYNSLRLIRFTRASNGVDFQPGNVQSLGAFPREVYQLTFAADESVLVGVVGSENKWQNNDLILFDSRERKCSIIGVGY
ncbi:hypothetical protein [Flaviaesturariibacter amylovorans]|uniref:Uncharacterized protein n=1 Tax=Flaviaesturariibacter amylovorans TaxID=1084520 RepID=A0ABP8GA49_9BACT